MDSARASVGPQIVFGKGNRNGFGGEIAPQSAHDEGQPDNLKSYRATKNTAYDRVARELNSATGGTATQSGAIDVSPETLKLWMSTLTGGVGSFVSDVLHNGELLARSAMGEEGDLTPETSEIPFARSFYKSESIKDSRSAFFSAANAAKDATADFRRAVAGDDQEGIDRVSERDEALLAVADWMAETQAMATALRKEVMEITADKEMKTGMKRITIRELEAEEKKILDDGLKEFRKATKPPKSDK